MQKKQIHNEVIKKPKKVKQRVEKEIKDIPMQSLGFTQEDYEIYDAVSQKQLPKPTPSQQQNQEVQQIQSDIIFTQEEQQLEQRASPLSQLLSSSDVKSQLVYKNSKLQ